MVDLSNFPDLAEFDAPARTVKAPVPSAPVFTAWLHDRSLASKLRLAISSSVLVPMMLVAALLLCILYLGESGTEKAKTATAHLRIGHAAMSLADVGRDASRMVDGSGAQELSHLKRDVDEAQRLIGLASSYSEEEIPADIAVQISAFSARIDELGALSDQLTLSSSAAQFSELVSSADALRKDIETYSVDLHERTSAGGQRLISEVAVAARASVALAIVVSLLTFLLARAIIRNMSRTIFKLANSMERLADGETDVAIPGAERGDELGAMARALGVFRSSSLALRDLTAERVRNAEAQLAKQKDLNDQEQQLRNEKREMLAGLSDAFEVGVGDFITSLSSSSDQLRITSQSMVSLAERSATQSQKASAAMDVTTTNLTAAAAATDEFALSISQISKRAYVSALLARDATALVHTANTRMDDLSQSAEEIGEIIELIQTIAQRTNLLALNASIEAARGGEAGVGFAVVAREVKELANQTQAAANNVTDRVTAMQNSTSSSAEDLTSIVSQITELEEAAVAIASAVDQQSASGAELAKNIDTVAAGSAVVGQQLEQLNEASQKTGIAAKDVLGSAQSLGKLAGDVRANSAVFINKVRYSSENSLAEEFGMPIKAQA